MDPELRWIRSDERLKLRSLRLRALADAPMAFGSTVTREESFSENVWHERTAGGACGADRVTFIIERDREWLGLASVIAKDPSNPADPGPFLVGMFVDSAERGHGLGAALVEAVAGWARSRGAGRLYL